MQQWKSSLNKQNNSMFSSETGSIADHLIRSKTCHEVGGSMYLTFCFYIFKLCKR